MTEAIQDALLDIATRPDVTPFRAKLLLKDAGMPNAATRRVPGAGRCAVLPARFRRVDSARGRAVN
jgi:hypothetical protein